MQKTKPLVYMVLTNSFFKDPRVFQEAASLRKYDYPVYVLTWDRNGVNSVYNEDYLTVKNKQLLRSKSFSKIIYMLSAVLFQLSIFVTGLNLLKKNQHIILHINDFNTILGSVLLKFIFPNRIKAVYDSHELTPAVYGEWYGQIFASITSKVEKICMHFMDQIITVSPPIEQYFRTITKKDIKIIWNYPAKDLIPKQSKEEARKELGLDQSAFILTYIGTLRNDIALFDLFHALALLREKITDNELLKKISVVIIGDGPLYSDIVSLREELQLEELITIIGRVNRDKSLLYMKAADLSYILFTVKGLNTKIGMPWKLFESLATNTPVLVLDQTYASKFIKKFNAGFIVNKKEPMEIADLLLAILKQEYLMTIETNNKLLWENQEEKFISIYNMLYHNIY
ncbi:MAG: glycosyltransferase family 4 protein [Asgard group archaeon]|nr:glycosyltransferase family 4 protein [Asgard group archaeon]